MILPTIKSQFEVTRFTNGEWVTETIYYYNDHTNFDPNDWRFREVYEKRKQLKFIKLCYE